MTGPLDRQVSSIRSHWSAWRGLRSLLTSTSSRMTLWSNRSILDNFSTAC